MAHPQLRFRSYRYSPYERPRLKVPGPECLLTLDYLSPWPFANSLWSLANNFRIDKLSWTGLTGTTGGVLSAAIAAQAAKKESAIRERTRMGTSELIVRLAYQKIAGACEGG